jgi:hypothetical protein
LHRDFLPQVPLGGEGRGPALAPVDYERERERERERESERERERESERERKSAFICVFLIESFELISSRGCDDLCLNMTV